MRVEDECHSVGNVDSTATPIGMPAKIGFRIQPSDMRIAGYGH
jgi:hypothetical protein